MSQPRLQCVVMVLAFAVCGLALPDQAWAQGSAIPDLIDVPRLKLEISSATFLTSLDGDGAEFNEARPEQYHGLVVTLRVTKAAGQELTLHPADLSLHYRRAGGEYDVAPCQGISNFSTAAEVDRTMNFFSAGWGRISTGASTVGAGTVYVDLFFQNMEADTRDLHLLVAQPVGAHVTTPGWTPEAMPAETAGTLDGVWLDETSNIRMTVARQGDGYTVTAARDDDDGEVYPVSGVSWDGSVLRWTTEVPSTGYRITWTTVSRRGDRLETAWSGTAGSGTESLRWVGSASEAVGVVDGSSSGLDGVWVDDSTGTRMTIARQGAGYAVTSAVDDDGEVFPVTNVSWDGSVLRWTYDVPSTGYRISWATVARHGNRLETTWTGTAGSGSELLRLVENAPQLVEAVPGSASLQLDGLGIRLVHVDRRLADADEAARRLRALGATVELFETTDSGNESHTGILYVRSGYRQLADAIIGAVGDLEQLAAAEGTTFSPGQQFNLWMTR